MRTLALAVLIMMPALAPAHAQVARTGTRVGAKMAEPPPGPSEADAQRFMHDYAKCAFKASPRETRDYLEAFPDGTRAKRLLSKIVTAECLTHGRLKFKASLLRGALYEYMYKANDVKLEPTRLQAVPKIDFSAGADAQSEVRIEQVSLRNFAECVIRARPADTGALIEAPIGSRQEAATFGALAPAFNDCLVQGQKWSFSKPALRGLIAEVLYRLSSTPAGAIQ